MLILSTPMEGTADADASQIVAAIQGEKGRGKLPMDDAWIISFASQAARIIPQAGLRTSATMGRILHETNYLRYGGDVDWRQNNFAGLGATGGVTGLSFPDVATGLKAVCAHTLAYGRGDSSKWPAAVRDWAQLDPRYRDVVSLPDAGRVRLIGDYSNGRWAYSKDIPRLSLENGYAYGILRAGNKVREQPSILRRVVPQPHIELFFPMDGGQEEGRYIHTSKMGSSHPHETQMISNHVTAPPAPNLSDHGSLRYLTLNPAQASVHFLIARDGTIYWGGVPLDQSAWTNGLDYDLGPGPYANPWKSDLTNPMIAALVRSRMNPNCRTVAIEHEAYNGQGMTQKQWSSSRHLNAWLCQENSLQPVAKLTMIGHFQIDGINRPNCPGWTAAQWAEHEAGVRAILGNVLIADEASPFIRAWQQGGSFSARWGAMWQS